MPRGTAFFAGCRRAVGAAGRIPALWREVVLPRYPVQPTAILRREGAKRATQSHGWRLSPGRVTDNRLNGRALVIHLSKH